MDLSTTYMGLKLKNPLVAAASPLSYELANLKRMEDAGAAAIVLFSLFEEQIESEQRELFYYMSQGTESFAESLTYFPEPESFNTGPEEYLELIRKAKESTSIPIIASLNGVSRGGWIDYARKMEQAGADALELNVYLLPTNPEVSGSEIESVYSNVLAAVKACVKIPVAMKLSPFFSSIPNMARKLDRMEADAFVLFNRFYQPDINLEKLEVEPMVTLSRPGSMLLSLRWIAILFGHVRASLAASGGIHTAEDVLKNRDGRRRRYPDGRRAPEKRHRPPDHGAPGYGSLDDPARIRLARRDEGLDEPPLGRRAGRFRARQLHEGAQRLHPPLRLAVTCESRADA